MTRRTKLAISLTAFAVVALAVRVTVRDRVPGLAVLFYATPLPVLAGLFFAGAAGWWSARSRRGALVSLAAAIAIGAWAASVMVRLTPARGPGADTIRLLLWNVASSTDAEGRLAAIARENADVVAFVETSMTALSAEGRAAADVRKRMVVLAPGAIAEEECADLGSSARCRIFSLVVRERALRLVLFDSAGNPIRDRRVGMERLRARLATLEGPTIVMGDFNLPADSAWFDPLRATHLNAFEATGRGWAGTWPVFAPVLQLDHVWVSREAEVVQARHGWSTRSDHRPVIVDVRLRD